jgi:hypothetical protein
VYKVFAYQIYKKAICSYWEGNSIFSFPLLINMLNSSAPNNRSLKRLVEICMEAQISLLIRYRPYIKTNSFKVIVRIMHLKKRC